MSSSGDYPNVSRSFGEKFFFHPVSLIGLLFLSISVIADCGNMEVLEKGGISCSLLRDIVSAHNELRDSIAGGVVKNQPAASDMRELYWDEELATGAQDWANQCTFAHNEDKDREVARFQVAQSLALTKSKPGYSSPEKEFRKQISKWFDENENFAFGPIRSIEDLQTVGHYTQLAWADTYLVGCGYSRYRSSSNVTYRLYVCHYGPRGNEVGKEPYQSGKQKCPNDLIPSKQYPNLCSLKKSLANPCGVKQKGKDTHVKNDPEPKKKPKKLLDGRKFLFSEPTVSSNTKVDAIEDHDEGKKNNSNVDRSKFDIFFNFHFNFS